MDDRHDFPADDLATLVGSRLCHDLVNPLSAISNGLELLAMTGSAPSPELALIEAAVKDAHARIRFFRIAFGAARPGDRLSHREVSETLAGLHGGGRLTVTWCPLGDLPRAVVKLAFLMLACAETALPMGGCVTITQEDDGWLVLADTQKLAVDPALWDGLTNPGGALSTSPAQVQFALLAAQLMATGRRLRLEVSEDRLEMRV